MDSCKGLNFHHEVQKELNEDFGWFYPPEEQAGCRKCQFFPDMEDGMCQICNRRIHYRDKY